MAKSASTSGKQKRTVKRRRGGGRMRAMVTLLALAITVIAALPTFIVVVVGMVPTLVAFIVDLTPGRYLCRCVAGLNVAGVAPFVHKLWTGQNTVEAAIRIIGDSFAWLAFYGAAGFGWMLFLSLPGAVTTVQTLNARRQVHQLRQTQRDLDREWNLTGSSDKSEPGDAAKPGDEGAAAGAPAAG